MTHTISRLALFAATVAAIVMAALTVHTAFTYPYPPSLPEFIVGRTIWEPAVKTRDLLALPLAAAAFVLTFALAYRALSSTAESSQTDNRRELASQILWWALPAIFVFARYIVFEEVAAEPIQISALGIGALLLASMAPAVRNQHIPPTTLSLSLLAVLLIGMLPFPITLLLGRLPMAITGTTFLDEIFTLPQIIAFASLLFAAWLALLWTIPGRAILWTPRLLLVGQISLALYYMALYPARFVQADGTLAGYETTAALPILILIFMLWTIADIVRRYRAGSNGPMASWTRLLAPMALFALVISFRMITLEPMLSRDDYHFGEDLIGWWAYQQGYIPYVDFMPPHGLLDNDLPGFLSLLFHDGSAISIGQTAILARILVALVCYLAIYATSGSLALALIAATVTDVRLMIWTLLGALLYLWFNPNLMQRPSRWLSVWLLTSILIVLAAPAQGAIMVVASSIPALYFAWQFFTSPGRAKWRGPFLALALIAVAAAFTPLIPMAIGASRYVLENGAINQAAYGIPWTTEGISPIAQFARISFMIAPAILLLLVILAPGSKEKWQRIALPALLGTILVLLVSPYALGRFDSARIGRSGEVGFFVWAMLLPLVAWPLMGRYRQPALAVLMILAVATLGTTSSSFLTNIATNSAGSIPLPYLLQDSKAAGLPNIGPATAEEEHWARLTALNSLLDSKLPEGESYLDLTNRNAQYFYMDRLPPVEVTAPYNMAAISQQQRAISRLTESTPRVALLEGDNMLHDGGPLNLRTPLLARFVMQNYTPSFEQGFVIGYDKDDPITELIPTTIQIKLNTRTDDTWDRGIVRTSPRILLDPVELTALFRVGDVVTFASGQTRTVKNVGTAIIDFEGEPLDPAIEGAPGAVSLTIPPDRLAWYRTHLLQYALGTENLRQIPVSWGRAESSLADRMVTVLEISPVPAVARHLISTSVTLGTDATAPAPFSTWTISGTRPMLLYDLGDATISGQDAGLLRFDFACTGGTEDPEITIFWWNKDSEATIESRVIFTAMPGRLIIPLDASAWWLATEDIRYLRIHLNPAGCEQFSISNMLLAQRAVVAENQGQE